MKFQQLQTGLIVILALVGTLLACSMPFNGSAELPDDGPPVAVRATV